VKCVTHGENRKIGADAELPRSRLDIFDWNSAALSRKGNRIRIS